MKELKDNVQALSLTPVEQEMKAFELIQLKAKTYASSTIVPTNYQGNGNLGNVVIALDMANRLNCNPLMVMQNLYIVHGNPAWSSKFLIATINSCGRFTPLRYEYKAVYDDKKNVIDTKCRAYAYEKGDVEHKEALYGAWVSMDMAKKEGWATKAGSKWNTMPQQMLGYRAAAFWQRLYAPEISMGLMTAEEAEDIRSMGEPVEADFSEIMENPIEAAMNAQKNATNAPQGEKASEEVESTE